MLSFIKSAQPGKIDNWLQVSRAAALYQISARAAGTTRTGQRRSILVVTTDKDLFDEVCSTEAVQRYLAEEHEDKLDIQLYEQLLKDEQERRLVRGDPAVARGKACLCKLLCPVRTDLTDWQHIRYHGQQRCCMHAGVRHEAPDIRRRNAQVQKCSRAGLVRCHAECLRTQRCNRAMGQAVRSPTMLIQVCWPPSMLRSAQSSVCKNS